MSIQPYYAYLEMKGIKTVEMRKTEPKDKEWSGKVKVYVSQNKKSFNRIPKEYREWFKPYVGKVAYEFMKGGIMCEEALHMRHGLKDSCLTHEELDGYSKGKRIYGYRITDLIVYDKPKALDALYAINACTKDCREYHADRCEGVNRTGKCGFGCKHPVTRPPQSWQYIQELED